MANIIVMQEKTGISLAVPAEFGPTVKVISAVLDLATDTAVELYGLAGSTDLLVQQAQIVVSPQPSPEPNHARTQIFSPNLVEIKLPSANQQTAFNLKTATADVYCTVAVGLALCEAFAREPALVAAPQEQLSILALASGIATRRIQEAAQETNVVVVEPPLPELR